MKKLSNNPCMDTARICDVLSELMGNPNSGKTAIFNLLTGMNLKVSNYPGITVEMRRGMSRLSPEKTIEIMDMPGTYSLTPESLDERIVAQEVLQWMQRENLPKAIISVLNAGNLRRNLYLTSQLLDLDIPIIVHTRNAEIDTLDILKSESRNSKLKIPNKKANSRRIDTKNFNLFLVTV